MATELEVLAAWVLLVANGISLLYELWRATARAGTSRHDSMKVFLVQGAVIYGVAAIVVLMLFAGTTGSAWAGLALALVSIAVSVFYYNPVVMSERSPGIIDWVEDLVFTGLLFVAAALLMLEVSGRTLVS
jgi:hypothetical protein